MKLPTNQFVLIDTEYTAWEGSAERGWSGPNEYRELIQLAAIRVDSETLEEKGHFNEYVFPVRNTKLSDYITTLTGITQKIVDTKAKPYPDTIQEFSQWANGDHIFSWGGDEIILFENCGFHQMECPLPLAQFSDIRSFFLEKGIPARLYASSTIIEAFNHKNTNAAHDALNDVRGILLALTELKNRR